MKIAHFSTAALALFTLAACENKAEVVSSVAPDPMAAEIANRAPVELPPMMTSEVTLRCKDQNLVVVSFFQGDKQVLIKSDKGATPVRLTAEKAGDPYKADGYELTGDKAAVTVTQPGKPAQSCKA